MDFIQAINEAIKEAFKQEIRANAIFINKGFVATKPIMLSLFGHAQIVKPMILGLKADITDDLPEEFAFAICEVDDEKLLTEHEKKIRKETVKEFAKTLISVLGEEEKGESITLKDLYGVIKDIANAQYGVEVNDD